MDQSNDLIIQAKELTKQFGNDIAVENITFAVPRGTIFGFIGPSGSGKTTTIRLLNGIYKPTSGDVAILGRSKGFNSAIRRKIGYMPQHFVLYPDLTVWENLNFAASIYGMGWFRGKRLNQLLNFVELSDSQHKLAREISGGMQRRLSLAATLIHNPELVFLDEPTASIDPILRQKFWDHFRELQNQGRTIFVTTQYVGEAAYCDLVGVISEGHLIAVDTPDGLRRRTFGGEFVDLKTSAPIDFASILQLHQMPFVKGDVTQASNNSLRLIVDNASTAIPEIVSWCKDRKIEVVSIEEYVPPFDDVFVELIKKDSN
ncbi:MAG: ABC transporter ATP-binding protein [Chloroflexi bacterium]|nr:ABC transporter ATP-binding protein [Chloroflexota bacterium]